MTTGLIDAVDSFSIAKNIVSLEKYMLSKDQVDCSVNHHFGPGVYIREVTIPTGTFAIGHKQKTKHLNIFLAGKVLVFKEDGSRDLLQAPMIFTGDPGRKVGLVIEKVVWLNVYATTERDIATLEATYLEKSEAFTTAELLRQKDTKEDKEDFIQAIKELGFTEQEVQEQSETVADQIPFMDDMVSVKVDISAIDRQGLFATKDFLPGQIICPARLGAYRTPAGRYTNHAKYPNAKVEFSGDIFYLKAIKPIIGCRGGFNGDEITIDYRQSVAAVRRHKVCQE